MLIGILCEVTSAVATEEKEIILVKRVHKEFTDVWRKFDKESSGSLTWESFVDLLADSKCHDALRRIDVNVEALIDMAEDIFFLDHGCDGEVELTYDEFIQLLLDLRGSQHASVKDVLTVGKRLNAKIVEMKAMLEFIACKLQNTHGGTSLPLSHVLSGSGTSSDATIHSSWSRDDRANVHGQHTDICNI